MAKQNRYADKASQQIEVGGRKLRTFSAANIRKIMAIVEERERQSPGFNDKFQDRDAFKGATFEAIRLKRNI